MQNAHHRLCVETLLIIVRSKSVFRHIYGSHVSKTCAFKCLPHDLLGFSLLVSLRNSKSWWDLVSNIAIKYRHCDAHSAIILTERINGQTKGGRS